jgi:uncharacterized protein (DUF362 family)
MKMTRRELFGTAATGAVALGGVTLAVRTKSTAVQHWPVPAVPPSVSIVKAPAYTMDVYDTVYRIVSEHKLNVRGKRIVLKPNLVEFDPHTAINTHPVVVHAAYEAFRRLGAAEVRIAEGPGHRRATLDLADAAGYFATVPKFEDLFTDLNLDDVAKRVIPQPVSQLKSLYLPHTVLDCDLLVSLPKMKTHHWAGATLAMKNLFGLVPGGVYGWPKNVLHWAGIAESIVDLHHLFPRQFAIVDGIVGMEGNGPIQGTPKQAGVLVAGSDVAAVDATCCRIMGIDPKKIAYLSLARGEENLGESAFRQIGEPVSSVRTPFQLIDPWRQMIQAA